MLCYIQVLDDGTPHSINHKFKMAEQIKPSGLGKVATTHVMSINNCVRGFTLDWYADPLP